MTFEHEELIQNLKSKVQSLIALYEKAKEQNERLSHEREELVTRLEKRNNEFKDLETKYEILKVAKTVASVGENSHDAKIKINRIIREIDRCIALMNK